MFENSQDFLNISLGVGFLVLVIFVSMVCFYLVLVLRDVSKTTSQVEDLVTRIHDTVLQPLKALDFVVDKARPYIETLVNEKTKEKKKK